MQDKEKEGFSVKIGVMQPYFFPYIGYWQLLANVDTYVVFDDVNYIKRGWVNRNAILLGGHRHIVTLSLKKASQNKRIIEIELADNAKLLKTIAQAYAKAPQYDSVMPLIERVMCSGEQNLADFLYISIRAVADFLSLKTTFVRSSEMVKDESLKGAEKVRDICQRLGATQYWNAIGGKELYSHDFFAEKGISLAFVQPQCIKYAQGSKEFVPWLSIIDMLMFNSRQEMETQLMGYTLV